MKSTRCLGEVRITSVCSLGVPFIFINSFLLGHILSDRWLKKFTKLIFNIRPLVGVTEKCWKAINDGQTL